MLTWSPSAVSSVSYWHRQSLEQYSHFPAWPSPQVGKGDGDENLDNVLVPPLCSGPILLVWLIINL